ncbi:hypothetical protein SAMN05428954_2113 [Streptomyces sp. 2112.3]|nr:hypothetical protein BX261_5225 [Streptomyces sp. 2321.6]SDR19762.1 hypothetical protein SAMN05216511_2036 [Streptomyces sp. KS_16]SED60295.1 hypothetical protein SAMN05428940_5251 [Streptomyces sp. 2133.1]SEE23573.1 hypothetical protein SAMN05428954_2113 [Streptomyces sp. 2112.3]SNC71246.1 hypothetical protein SAMN06272741_5151 [Streptomyces sp. 2114.4]
MRAEEVNPDEILAEIILSKKVGTAHVRLIGDLISVDAQLSIAALQSGGLPLEQMADIAEAVLPLEGAYIQAWDEVNSEPGFEESMPKLQELERALRNAVEGIIEIAQRYQLSVSRTYLD